MKRVDILQSVLVTFILVNFTMLYAAANYSDFEYSPPNLSDKIWYIVEGGIYPLMSVCFFYFNQDRNFKTVWLTLGIFFVIRWAWEIIAFTLDLNLNKPKIPMAIMFSISFGAIIFITFLPYLRKLWKSR